MDSLIFRLLEPEIFYPPNGRVVVPYRAKKFGAKVKFEEIYFSEILPESLKGCKRHRNLYTRLYPIQGTCVIGVSKELEIKTFKKIELSYLNPKILEIKPMSWFFMKNISKELCILMNAIECHSNDVENASLKGLD